jgi:4-hydroxybenzoyl-CoA thioesterase
MIFTTRKLIRFQHCDPAGIVFYPQYYVLLHEAQEDWFTHIGHPEHDLIASGYGVPIVNMQTDFLGMSRHGEEVAIEVSLFKLGNASLGIRYELYSALRREDVRLKAKGIVVYSRVPEGGATPFPAGLRAAMLPYLVEDSP